MRFSTVFFTLLIGVLPLLSVGGCADLTFRDVVDIADKLTPQERGCEEPEVWDGDSCEEPS